MTLHQCVTVSFALMLWHSMFSASEFLPKVILTSFLEPTYRTVTWKIWQLNNNRYMYYYYYYYLL